MNRDELRTRMADYLDGLLDEDEARAVEARIAEEPALFAEVAHVRAVLHRPYAVPAPAADQQARILRRHRDRPLARAARYAAVFAAGVLTALLATARLRSEPAPVCGQTVFQAQVPSSLTLTGPLSRRLLSEAIAAGLIPEAEQHRALTCFEEAIKNAVVHGPQGSAAS